MEPITEFPLFRHFPPEIRIKIWKFVPQPTRVIGLLPPVSTWYRYRQYHYAALLCGTREGLSTDGQPYHYRYIVQPKRQAIFPPLHVNREARMVWLPRYFQPPRRDRISGLKIQFGTPFISYDTDLFTIFDGWSLTGLEFGTTTGSDVVDSFIGLERSRIRKIALYENPRHIERMASAMSIATLPNLEVMTILSMGPSIFSHFQAGLIQCEDGSIALVRDEMPVVDTQRTSCEIHDLSTDVVQNHPFFNDKRLFHPGLEPLHRFQTIIKSWLWHEMQAKNLNRTASQITGVWWQWMDYLFGGDEDEMCPLTLDGCGDEGHIKREMLEWECPFSMDYKLLCADTWQDELKRCKIIT